MARGLSGLMIAVSGKPKKSADAGGDGDDEESGPKSNSVEDGMIDEMFRAAKNDDPAGFRMAFKGAVEACIRREVKADSIEEGSEY